MDSNRFDQIILIDKPAGISSFGVVARVRRKLTLEAGKKIKVGHCGTLDPFATGLMILVSGKMTKRAGEFAKLDKEYLATIQLGATSNTGDPEGEVETREVAQPPSKQEVEKTLKEFIGQIIQTPPRFSAIKINGRRAYKLARSGQEFTVPNRNVTIYSIELLSYDYPNLIIKTQVSSGTYIRTLAEDIGEKLGCGAYTKELRRTKIDHWKVEDAEVCPYI